MSGCRRTPCFHRRGCVQDADRQYLPAGLSLHLHDPPRRPFPDRSPHDRHSGKRSAAKIRRSGRQERVPAACCNLNIPGVPRYPGRSGLLLKSGRAEECAGDHPGETFLDAEKASRSQRKPPALEKRGIVEPPRSSSGRT